MSARLRNGNKARKTDSTTATLPSVRRSSSSSTLWQDATTPRSGLQERSIARILNSPVESDPEVLEPALPEQHPTAESSSTPIIDLTLDADSEMTQDRKRKKRDGHRSSLKKARNSRAEQHEDLSSSEPVRSIELDPNFSPPATGLRTARVSTQSPQMTSISRSKYDQLRVDMDNRTEALENKCSAITKEIDETITGIMKNFDAKVEEVRNEFRDRVEGISIDALEAQPTISETHVKAIVHAAVDKALVFMYHGQMNDPLKETDLKFMETTSVKQLHEDVTAHDRKHEQHFADIDELRLQMKEKDDKISALEEDQKTTATRLSALEAFIDDQKTKASLDSNKCRSIRSDVDNRFFDVNTRTGTLTGRVDKLENCSSPSAFDVALENFKTDTPSKSEYLVLKETVGNIEKSLQSHMQTCNTKLESCASKHVVEATMNDLLAQNNSLRFECNDLQENIKDLKRERKGSFPSTPRDPVHSTTPTTPAASDPTPTTSRIVVKEISSAILDAEQILSTDNISASDNAKLNAYLGQLRQKIDNCTIQNTDFSRRLLKVEGKAGMSQPPTPPADTPSPNSETERSTASLPSFAFSSQIVQPNFDITLFNYINKIGTELHDRLIAIERTIRDDFARMNAYLARRLRPPEGPIITPRSYLRPSSQGVPGAPVLTARSLPTMQHTYMAQTSNPPPAPTWNPPFQTMPQTIRQHPQRVIQRQQMTGLVENPRHAPIPGRPSPSYPLPQQQQPRMVEGGVQTQSAGPASGNPRVYDTEHFPVTSPPS